LLTETIADHLLKYVRRLEQYDNQTKDEIKEIIKKNIDLSKNRKKSKGEQTFE